MGENHPQTRLTMVAPFYNEEAHVAAFLDRLLAVLAGACSI